MNRARQIAEAGLEVGAIKLNPNDPFTWASGYRMPIYNDNRMFLFDWKNRSLVLDGFYNLSEDRKSFVVAGTSTSGIPWGAILSDMQGLPFIYVRDKPKDHGLRNQIEGIDAKKDLDSRRVIVIEDLISTGGSSARAVQAVRDANGHCDECWSIFDYELDRAQEAFDRLDPACRTESLLTYSVLLDVAVERGYIDGQQQKMLGEWRANPFEWGEKHGFPKVEK